MEGQAYSFHQTGYSNILEYVFGREEATPAIRIQLGVIGIALSIVGEQSRSVGGQK
jgi:hypothetical protein